MIKNITFGIVSSFARKTKKRKKQPSLGAILSLMLAIQLQICSIKKMEHIFVCFLPEDAAPVESTANITIGYPLYRTVNWLIRQRIFLEELDLAHSDKI